MSSLYHYCGTETFAAIVRSRSLWLSSLSLANDSLEGRLVSHALMRLAERDGLDAESREKLKTSLAYLEGMFDGLGFCLSADGDLLSQWRGYADDGRGVSVGFNREYLEKLSELSRGPKVSGFALVKVEYEPDAHETKIEPTYRELRRLIDEGAFKRRGLQSLMDTRTKEEIAVEDERIEQRHRSLFLQLLLLFPHLFELKSAAFSEEKEWRLLSMLTQTAGDSCLYRAKATRVVPYRSFELLALEIPAISDVILGPRHETPINIVEAMLKVSGFDGVRVRRSTASYR